MSREILFRGMRHEGQWVFGYLCSESGIDDETIGLPWRVIPETVGQYTGLRDSKRSKDYPEGQRVFENDRIKVHYEAGIFGTKECDVIGAIVYQDCAFFFKSDDGKINEFAYIVYEHCEIEVIGTIHDKEKE